MTTSAAIQSRFDTLRPVFDEPARRLWAAAEALALGRGGISRVAAATGLSRTTIRQGLGELRQPASPPPRRRKPGAGRAPLYTRDPTLLDNLQSLLDPPAQAPPFSPLRWTCKSVRQLAYQLQALGHSVAPRKVADLLRQLNFRLQDTKQLREAALHPDRHAQFAFINERAADYLKLGHRVLSITPRRWHAKSPIEENTCSIAAPLGCTSLHPEPDTALFAVDTLNRWWRQIATRHYALSSDLFILLDIGPGNVAFSRSWQVALQHWANANSLRILVCYFPPPGTSHWRRLDSHILSCLDQHGPGPISFRHEVVLQEIGNPARQRPPFPISHARLSPTTLAASDPALANLRLHPAVFHPDWNYQILPRSSPARPGPGFLE